MTRRKSMSPREANGQTKRSSREPEGPSPTSIARLRQASLRGQEDPKWSTTLGMLSLGRKITDAQFAAGLHWAELQRAITPWRAWRTKQPRSVNLEPMGGTLADPNTAQGHREAAREARTLHRYIASLAALKLAGEAPRAAVAHVVERDQWIAGAMELEDLRTGLSALAEWFAGGARK